jgi:hypothetical protein
MLRKTRAIIIIGLLILSGFFVGWNMNLVAETSNEQSDSNDNRAPPGTNDFHWGEIDVISEPVPWMDININNSDRPKIAVEGYNIHVVWYDRTDVNGAMGDRDIFYKKYDGSTWSPVEVVSEPILGSDKNTGQDYDPDIAVENGNVYVVWRSNDPHDSSGTDYDIFYRIKTNKGWSTIQVISEPTQSANNNLGVSSGPKIAVENQIVHVVWYDNSDLGKAGTDYDIFYRNLTKAGWSKLYPISEPMFGDDFNNKTSYYPDICGENGNIYTVWYDYNETDGSGADADIFFRQLPNNKGWQPIQVISEPIVGKDANTGSSTYPKIAVDNGDIYAIWEDNNASKGSGTDYDIILRKSTDGKNWGSEQVISEPKQGLNTNIGNSYRCAIDVEFGKVHTAWYDSNDTNGAGTDYDIFYRCYRTGNWEDVQVISEPETDNDNQIMGSTYPDIQVENNKSYAVWHSANDTKNCSFFNFKETDIHFRMTYLEPELRSPEVSPTIGNTSTVFRFEVEYWDIDNEPPTEMSLRLNGVKHSMVQSNPGDQNFIDGKRFFFETTMDIGVLHSFRFIGSDGNHSANTPIINLPDVFNTPPEILTPPLTVATEDLYYESIYEYWDMDNITVDQQMTWDFDTNAPWLTFTPNVPINESGVLNGTPTNDDVGEYYVNITINDTITETWSYYILTVEPVNDPPMIITEDVTTAIEDLFYEVVYKADDIDTAQENLTWNYESDADWLNFNKTTAILNGTPGNDDVGQYTVNIIVSDGDLADNNPFTLNVTPVNDPPWITTDDVDKAIVDEEYSVYYEADDIDNKLEDFEWSFNSNTGDWLIWSGKIDWLHGTPLEADVGEYWINMSVKDPEGAFDSHNFTLTVEMPPIINLNPEIQGDNVLEIEAGKDYLATYTATDDRTALVNLTWVLDTNASWLTFDSETGNLSGTPTINDAGIYSVTLNVTDGEGGFAVRNFNIKVTKPPEPPKPENKEPKLTEGSMSPESGDTDTEFTFEVHYSDEDGDPPKSIAVVIDGEEHKMTLKDGNASNGTYEVKLKLDEGDHDYYFKAYDGKADAVPADDTPTSTATAESTPNISEVEPTSKGGDIGDWLWLIILLIIIIIVIILVAVLMRRKRKGAPAEEYETEDEERRPPEEEDKESEAKDKGELEDWEVEDAEAEEDTDIETEPEVEEEEVDDALDFDMEAEAGIVGKGAAAPPAKGKAPGIVRRGKDKKRKWPEKGKAPKGKKPKAEPEPELEPEEEELEADEEMAEELAIAEATPNMPLLTKLDVSTTCNICLGAIKTGLAVVQCTCGKKYHEACASRVGACPTCDTDLTNPQAVEEEEITEDDLESIDE